MIWIFIWSPGSCCPECRISGDRGYGHCGNGIRTLVLDASAACHMPDVLEMPYRPPLKDSGEAGEKAYTYRLSSCTCLAGDVIGDYSFDREIRIGDKLYFMDMAIYSMVKNNTFNGMPLPDIAVMHEDGECEVIRHFGYEDFKSRLSVISAGLSKKGDRHGNYREEQNKISYARRI